MGDYVQIELGRRPWQPTEDAESVEVFDFHDMPLAGIIRQHDVLFAYWCVDGAPQQASIWSYVWIDDSERSQLEDSDDLYTTLDELMSQRARVIALAEESKGIIETALVERDESMRAYWSQLLDQTEGVDWPLLRLAVGQ
jgi:hypothetical protein